MEEFERIEEARKAMKEAQKNTGITQEDVSDDEDKYEHEPSAPGQSGVDSYTRTSIRNLRIREDVAKYLLTNKNAAHYDPKSRSMRELPDGSQTVDDPKLQTGKQEFVRAATGDAADFEKLQKFAWQSERMGGDVHLQANPTEGEIRHRKLLEESEKKKAAVRSSVLDKYGGAEHLAAPPKELLKSSEQFVEYTKFGEVIRGAEVPKTKSRYAEDGMSPVPFFANLSVLINNHTSVYGSWFRNGKWGYTCCHQVAKNSYCTGQAGVEADEAAQRLARGEIEDMPPPPVPKKETSKLVVDGESIRSAIKESTKRKRPDDSDRRFEDRQMSAADKAMISEEEYEEWRRNKMARSDDPLLAMQNMEGKV